MQIVMIMIMLIIKMILISMTSSPARVTHLRHCGLELLPLVWNHRQTYAYGNPSALSVPPQPHRTIFSPDVLRSLFLKRLPADIQQILLVSDFPLEQLAFRVDAMIVANAPTITTVSAAAAATPAVTIEFLAALDTALSEAVRRLSTRECSHSRPRSRTPSPPRSDRNFKRSPTPGRQDLRRLTEIGSVPPDRDR